MATHKLEEDKKFEKEENKVFRQLVKDIDTKIKVESYFVKTEDKYILKVFHLIKDKRGRKKGPPILLQHGLFQNAEKFVFNGKQSLAIQLLEVGFDVWLGNNRGCIYSRGHETLSTVNDAYFDFSFFEMGKYDMPATVDAILDKLGKKKLTYIGYSQGTAQMFSALSYNHGDLQNKLNLYIALAPIARLDNTTHEFFINLGKYVDSLQKLLYNTDTDELFGPGFNAKAKFFCALAKKAYFDFCYSDEGLGVNER